MSIEKDIRESLTRMFKAQCNYGCGYYDEPAWLREYSFLAKAVGFDAEAYEQTAEYERFRYKTPAEVAQHQSSDGPDQTPEAEE